MFLSGSQRAQKRQRQQLVEGRSILDAVGDQTKALNRRISGGDRKQLTEYYEAIRSAEKDLSASDQWLDRPKPTVDMEIPMDTLDPSELTGKIKDSLNLIPLILQTDSTRVVSLMIQDHQAVPNMPGVQSGHHPLSHHGRPK